MTTVLEMPNFLLRSPDGSLNLEGNAIQTISVDEVINRINNRKLTKCTKHVNDYDVKVVIPTTVSTVGKRRRKDKPTTDVENPSTVVVKPSVKATDVVKPSVKATEAPVMPITKPKRKRRTKKEMATSREIAAHWRWAEASEAPTPTVKAAKPKKGKRGKGGEKMSDAEMMRLIADNFDGAGGKWSKMMGILRELGASCSQGRVRALYMKVEAKRQEEQCSTYSRR